MGGNRLYVLASMQQAKRVFKPSGYKFNGASEYMLCDGYGKQYGTLQKSNRRKYWVFRSLESFFRSPQVYQYTSLTEAKENLQVRYKWERVTGWVELQWQSGIGWYIVG